MTDDAGILLGFFLVFCQKFLCARKCNLGDVTLDLVLGHTDTVIRNDQLLFIVVDGDNHLRLIAFLFRCFPDAAQAFQLFDCVTAVGNNLSQENILIRIQPLLNNWKYVFGINTDLSFTFHEYLPPYFKIILSHPPETCLLSSIGCYSKLYVIYKIILLFCAEMSISLTKTSLVLAYFLLLGADFTVSSLIFQHPVSHIFLYHCVKFVLSAILTVNLLDFSLLLFDL